MSQHQELVLALLDKWGNVPEGGIRLDHYLLDDLKVDGDDYAMSLVPAIQKSLGIKPTRREWEQVATVQQLLDLVERHVTQKGSEGGQASA
jgi:acyl carrier protein